MTTGNLTVAGKSWLNDQVLVTGRDNDTFNQKIITNNTAAFSSSAGLQLVGTGSQGGVRNLYINTYDDGNDIGEGIYIDGVATAIRVSNTQTTGQGISVGNLNAVDYNMFTAATGKNTYTGYFYGGNYNNAASPSGRFLSFTKQVVDKFYVDLNGNTFVDGNLEINADLNHDGSNIGFYGTAPVAQSAAYTASNVTTDRTYDANSTTIDELADVLGTLITDLKATGIIG